jgi:SAM-dependent methyltransferase/FKBP-type peptidyl-prolyl cis-trans isomerase 2
MERTTPLYDEAASPQASGREAQRQPLEQTGPQAMAAMRLDLHWQSTAARHTDSLFAGKLNLWRDIFPPELERQVMGQPVGHRATHAFAPGELVPGPQERQIRRLPNAQFDRRFTGRGYVQPRAGRFYPRGILDGVEGVFRADRQPFRLAEVTGESLLADLNHPLADRALRLDCTIEEIWAQGDARGGRCNEVADLVTAAGPGMQARWRGRPTDFWSDGPFHRQDPRPDGGFYAGPRLVDHMDRTAIAEVSALYGRLIPAGTRVLDLMASWHSHLPPELGSARVTGLGMNQEELDANPVLAERVIQDLNKVPALPFPDAAFDAVVCTVSVEYLTQPFAVFREVARVLAPGGRFIVSFSNRWFPTKAIRLWEGIHEFERPGLVLEYFLESGLFGDLETWSLRGLPRPADDKYADRLLHSDPVYAVWGEKTRP